MLYVNVHEYSLLTTYCQGLKPKLQLHLSAYDDVIGLEKFIQLSIRVTQLEAWNNNRASSLHIFPANQSMSGLHNQVWKTCKLNTPVYSWLSSNVSWPRVSVCIVVQRGM